MAAPSAILKYLLSVLVCYVLFAVPSQGIYIKDRSSRQRGSERTRGRDNPGDDTSVEERRREPFTRTLVSLQSFSSEIFENEAEEEKVPCHLILYTLFITVHRHSKPVASMYCMQRMKPF